MIILRVVYKATGFQPYTYTLAFSRAEHATCAIFRPRDFQVWVYKASRSLIIVTLSVLAE